MKSFAKGVLVAVSLAAFAWPAAGQVAAAEAEQGSLSEGQVADQGASGTAASPTPEMFVELAGASLPNGGVTFGLPYEFHVTGYDNANFRYNMSFGETRVFRRVVVDFDVYQGRWGPGNPDWDYGLYSMFWMQNGRRWDDLLFFTGYLQPSSRLWNETNAGGFWDPDNRQYGLQVSSGCRTDEGDSYHLHAVYDTVAGELSVELLQGGQVRCSVGSEVGLSEIETSSMFIETGCERTEDGPEAWTLGWRYSNLKIQFLGDDDPPPPPPGRVPRRR